MTKDRWLSDLHWRRDSKQTRGEKTQAALLDAAEAMIVEKGTNGTSINDIAERAGSSVGSVYHHFKDKKALYYALFDRMTKTFIDLNQQAADPALWKDASVLDLFEGFIDFMMHLRVEAAQSKSAVALIMADDPELKVHMAEIKRNGRSALLHLVLVRRSEFSHPDSEFIAAFVIDQLGAMLFARSDNYQRLAAISTADDECFKTELLRFVAVSLQVQT